MAKSAGLKHSAQMSVSKFDESDKIRAEIDQLEKITGAQIQKLVAETAKLSAEARNDRGFRLWLRPGSWAALLPGLAACAAAYSAISNGYFEVAKERQEADTKKLIAEKTEASATKQISEWRIEVAQNAVKAEKLKLEESKAQLASTQTDIEKRKAELVKLEIELTAQKVKVAAALETAKVEIPLSTINSDPQHNSFGNEQTYRQIVVALKGSREPMLKKTVVDAIETAQGSTIKLLLLRSVYFAFDDQDQLTDIQRRMSIEPETFAENFAALAREEELWPQAAKTSLYIIAGKWAKKRKYSLQDIATVMSAVEGLCGYGCDLNGEGLLIQDLASEAPIALRAYP